MNRPKRHIYHSYPQNYVLGYGASVDLISNYANYSWKEGIENEITPGDIAYVVKRYSNDVMIHMLKIYFGYK